MDEEKHEISRVPGGEGFDLLLKHPDSDRKTVRIRILRGKDLRKYMELEKIAEDSDEDDDKVEQVNLVDFLCDFISQFSDLTPAEAEALSVEDLVGVRGVIRSQVKKLVAG